MKYSYFFIILCAALLIVSGWWLFFQSPSQNISPAFFDKSFPTSTPQIPIEISSPSPSPLPREVPEGASEYRSEHYRFSLLYPDFLSVKEYDEGAGARTISFESLEQSRGFQIFVVPYAGNQVSEAQFKKDIPSGVRKDLKDIMVAGATGAAFYSDSSLLGETREVWFIHGGYLYEVTTFKELDTWLDSILQTWMFN